MNKLPLPTWYSSIFMLFLLPTAWHLGIMFNRSSSVSSTPCSEPLLTRHSSSSSQARAPLVFLDTLPELQTGLKEMNPDCHSDWPRIHHYSPCCQHLILRQLNQKNFSFYFHCMTEVMDKHRSLENIPADCYSPLTFGPFGGKQSICTFFTSTSFHIACDLKHIFH